MFCKIYILLPLIFAVKLVCSIDENVTPFSTMATTGEWKDRIKTFQDVRTNSKNYNNFILALIFFCRGFSAIRKYQFLINIINIYGNEKIKTRDILKLYLYFLDPCGIIPCGSTGTCHATDANSRGYICVCKPGYTGVHCNISLLHFLYEIMPLDFSRPVRGSPMWFAWNL